MIELPVMVLPHGQGLPLPAYQTDGSAGLDLIAAVHDEDPIILAPLARALVPTGLVFQIPQGYEGQVRPRSGLAVKNGITVANAPGTIDSDYRGEVKVALINLGSESFTITRGMRVAQMVIAAVVQAALLPVRQVEASHRGAGGFGSTGTDGKQ